MQGLVAAQREMVEADAALAAAPRTECQQPNYRPLHGRV